MPIRAQLPTLRLIHVFKGYNILNLSNLLNPGIKHFIDFFSDHMESVQTEGKQSCMFLSD
jgi:hypothetical protein